MTVARPLEAETVRDIRDALARARRGDTPGAFAQVRVSLARGRDQGVLSALAGMLACQTGDLETGIAYLRQALAADAGDLATRANLAQSLCDTDRFDEAATLCDERHAAEDRSGRLWRLRAQLLQRIGDDAGAITAYVEAVKAAPADFESWNNLGNAQATAGDIEAAVLALGRAVALRPDLIEIRLNHASVIAEAGREEEAAAHFAACARDFPADPRPLGELGSLQSRLHRDEEALATLSRALVLAPDDPDINVRFGEQCVASFDNDRAENAFRAALAVDPRHSDAYIQLAILYDHTNRLDALAMLLIAAEDTTGVDPATVSFVGALALRRENRFREGLDAISRVPETIEPGRRAQLVGQFNDRLGEIDAAFAAFTEMNRLNALDPTKPIERAQGFRDRLREEIATVTPAWYRGWKTSAHLAPPPISPVFLVGFPRSGTTLLDTMLMGHPNVTVMEELSPLKNTETWIGGFDRLPALDSRTIDAARAQYYEDVRRNAGWRGDTILVDKFPMHLTKVPLIHRLFPEARFILALRHPCDVVLSCFITTFRLNNAMANFLDLATTAETYSLCFDHWTRCRSLLPIHVHEVRYEQVIADRAAELKSVSNYLGLEWNSQMLDHQKTAATRGAVRTASYAQVTEPLYQRAVGRWQRYQQHLEPVMPILAPWIDRLGYSIG